jgi:hypothetical protein
LGYIMRITESYIDTLIDKAALSPNNDLPEPTQQQKESGNYKKGHITFQGLKIAIENPKGSFRSGIDPNGNKWKTKMYHHYGYIKGTVGKDKDHIDIFIGPNYDSDTVVIVNQKNKDGQFDEHKCMLGFDNMLDGLKGYLQNYEKDWVNKGLVGSVVETKMTKFKEWLKVGNTKVPYK